jgi:hypothetical protein
VIAQAISALEPLCFCWESLKISLREFVLDYAVFGTQVPEVVEEEESKEKAKYVARPPFFELPLALPTWGTQIRLYTPSSGTVFHLTTPQGWFYLCWCPLVRLP